MVAIPCHLNMLGNAVQPRLVYHVLCTAKRSTEASDPRIQFRTVDIQWSSESCRHPSPPPRFRRTLYTFLFRAKQTDHASVQFENDLSVMYNTYTQTHARTHAHTHTRTHKANISLTQSVSHVYRLCGGNSQARHSRLRDINQQLSVCSEAGVLYAYCSRQVI